jgi:hypothetical protein
MSNGRPTRVRETPGQTIARGDVQQELNAFPVLDLRAVDPGFEHQSLRVYLQMSVACFDLHGEVSTIRPN